MNLLEYVDETNGIGANYAWDMVRDLTRVVSLPLFDMRGNIDGDVDNARLTSIRLTPVGRLATRAELGKGPPIPLGLINGTCYRGGSIPPLRGEAVVDVLYRLNRGESLSNEKICRDIGPPTFRSECRVAGDFGSLYAGNPVVLTLRARIEVLVAAQSKELAITHFPPGLWATDVERGLQYYLPNRSRSGYQFGPARLGISGIVDKVHGLRIHEREELHVTLEEWEDPERVVKTLDGADGFDAGPIFPIEGFAGVKRVVRACFPLPLYELITQWSHDMFTEGSLAYLKALRRATTLPVD